MEMIQIGNGPEDVAEGQGRGGSLNAKEVLSIAYLNNPMASPRLPGTNKESHHHVHGHLYPIKAITMPLGEQLYA